MSNYSAYTGMLKSASTSNAITPISNSIGDSIQAIVHYDIALAVVMMCLIFSLLVNGLLLYAQLKMKDVFLNVALALNTLNERLSSHGDLKENDKPTERSPETPKAP